MANFTCYAGPISRGDKMRLRDFASHALSRLQGKKRFAARSKQPLQDFWLANGVPEDRTKLPIKAWAKTENLRELRILKFAPARIATRDSLARLLIACMPKSGSTYVSEVLCNLPGLSRAHLVPGFQRREQELCPLEMYYAERQMMEARRLAFDGGQDLRSVRGYVAQRHVRHSKTTGALIDAFGVKPIVLVRNIFDIVPSLRDHLVKNAIYMPMAYFTEDMRDWPAEKIDAFIVDMAVPWYFNFFVSWLERPDALRVSFDDLMANKQAEFTRILGYAGLAVSASELAAAIDKADGGGKTRKNQGVAGRGSDLPEALKARIRQYAAYYPGVDFSSIGL